MVKRVEDKSKLYGVDLRGTQPTPGNIAGGLTTIEEKSLGCIHKAGRSPVIGVLEYAESIDPREQKRAQTNIRTYEVKEEDVV